MSVRLCPDCGQRYDDETRLTLCPHEDFGLKKLIARAALADLVDNPDVQQLMAEGDWQSVEGYVKRAMEKARTETPVEP